MVILPISPVKSANITITSPLENSDNFCLQPPHGVTGVELSAATATSNISVWPAAIIADIAPASAQVPSG